MRFVYGTRYVVLYALVLGTRYLVLLSIYPGTMYQVYDTYVFWVGAVFF